MNQLDDMYYISVLTALRTLVTRVPFKEIASLAVRPCYYVYSGPYYDHQMA